MSTSTSILIHACIISAIATIAILGVIFHKDSGKRTLWGVILTLSVSILIGDYADWSFKEQIRESKELDAKIERLHNELYHKHRAGASTLYQRLDSIANAQK